MKHEAQDHLTAAQGSSIWCAHLCGLEPDCMEQQRVNIPSGTSTLL